MEEGEFALRIVLDYPVRITERCFADHRKVYHSLGELIGLSRFFIDSGNVDAATVVMRGAREYIEKAVAGGVMPTYNLEFMDENYEEISRAFRGSNSLMAKLRLDILERNLYTAGLHHFLHCIQQAKESPQEQ